VDSGVLSIILYMRTTYAAKFMGTWGFWPVVIFLTFVWVTNVKSGPAPPERILGSLIFFVLYRGLGLLDRHPPSTRAAKV